MVKGFICVPTFNKFYQNYMTNLSPPKTSFTVYLLPLCCQTQSTALLASLSKLPEERARLVNQYGLMSGDNSERPNLIL